MGVITLKRNKPIVFGAMVLGAALTSMLYAQRERPKPAATRVVEAQMFVLKDADGREMARLEGIKGSPELKLYDRAGKTRILLSVIQDGSSIVSVGTTEAEHAGIAVDANGEVSVILNAMKNGTITLGVGKEVRPNIGFSLASGQKIYLPANRDVIKKDAKDQN